MESFYISQREICPEICRMRVNEITLRNLERRVKATPQWRECGRECALAPPIQPCWAAVRLGR